MVIFCISIVCILIVFSNMRVFVLHPTNIRFLLSAIHFRLFTILKIFFNLKLWNLKSHDFVVAISFWKKIILFVTL